MFARDPIKQTHTLAFLSEITLPSDDRRKLFLGLAQRRLLYDRR
jgi:hypothetical protein